MPKSAIWPNLFTSFLHDILLFIISNIKSGYHYLHTPRKNKVETTMITPPGSLFVCLLASVSFFTAISGMAIAVLFTTITFVSQFLIRLAVSALLSTAIPGKDSPLFPKIIQ